MKKILYVDMDNVLVDFPSAFPHVPNDVLDKYADNKDDILGIFSLMQPLDGAIDAYEKLSQKYDTYILSTAPWDNPSAAPIETSGFISTFAFWFTVQRQ